VKLEPKYAAKIAYGTEAYSRLLRANYDVVGRSWAEWTQRWTVHLHQLELRGGMLGDCTDCTS